MKHLTIILFGILISVNGYSQNELSNVDSTNYRTLLPKINNVYQKLRNKFSGQEYQKLVNILGSYHKTTLKKKSRLLRYQDKKRRSKAIIYPLDMIHYSQYSSYSSTLVVLLKRKIIKDIYINGINIRWKR